MAGEASDSKTGSVADRGYRGNSLIKKRTRLGHYRGTMPRALWQSKGGDGFEMAPVSAVQGYFAHKKQLPPRALQ